jgi:ferric-dicitrate binding protein FerR (iron transport regulator)
MQKEINNIEELLAEVTLLHWYFNLNDADVEYWENWAAQSTANRAMLEEAAAVLQTFHFRDDLVISEERINTAWNDLSDKMGEIQTEEKKAKLFSLSSYKRWMMAAAAVLIMIISGLYWYSATSNASNVKTEFGQIKEKVLPDGSSVILNANSTITTGAFHDGKSREVWLKGEAYFKVHKTSTKDRFIVHTNKVDIVVTGTQFNVISRNNTTSVYLKEGSVFLHAASGEEIHMKPGDYVEVKNGAIQFKPAKDKSILAWQERMLVFDNTPLSEVAQKMKDVYGVDVQVDAAIANKAISGVMPNNDLNVLLQSLEASQDFKIERINNTIKIMSN